MMKTVFSWYFLNPSRQEAERALLINDNPSGTFLIRPSENYVGHFTLSVKDWDGANGSKVKHYKIKLESDGGFSIGKKTYPDLPSIVQEHSSECE